MMASYAEHQVSEAPKAGPGNVARLVDRLSKDISTTHGKGVPIKPPKPSNNNSRTAHVRFSYVAQQDDELTLQEDDVIEVIEDVEDGWARGKLKERIGLFPTNFVSFALTPTTNITSYSTISRVSEESRKKMIKDEQPHATTNPTAAVANGKVSVEKVPSTGSNVLPSSFKASVRKNGAPFNNNGTSTTTSIGSNSTRNIKEYAKVLYEYKAINPDELDLREGDTVAVINRKCSDEGWCLGELNGKRGLFPENFVKITPATAGLSTSMPASGSTAPPVLPAKPLKPVGAFSNANKQLDTSGSTATSTMTNNPNAASTLATTTQSSDSNNMSTLSTVHKSLEERKSVVAGIQNKLFPQGKMPPHKPTFQPPSNLLTLSQHSSARGNADSDFIPVVQMRHSVVDPTKLTFSSVHFDDPHLSDVGESSDEPKQLESLTKFRPKQTNKRPPSTQFRTSKLVKADTPPSTPPLTPTTNAPTVAETVVVSTGPATTSFPAESRSPAQPASPNTNSSSRAQEVQSVVKELNSIAASVNNIVNNKPTPSPTGQTMGQKSSRNHSAGLAQSNFYSLSPATAADSAEAAPTTAEPVTRAEFSEFRGEILKRLAKLEEKILQMDVSAEPSERQQHF